MKGASMPNFCILWRQPRARTRTIIIIVIYVTAFHLTPHAALPLALGGLLGNWLTAKPGRFRLAYTSAAGGDTPW
jgi:hypothetical protein